MEERFDFGALLDAQFAPYLSSPFRMRGTKWAGLRIDNSTNSEVVFQLFDKAMQSNTQPLYNFSLGNEATSTTTLFKETPLPQAPARPLLPERIRTMTQICKFEKNIPVVKFDLSELSLHEIFVREVGDEAVESKQ